MVVKTFNEGFVGRGDNGPRSRDRTLRSRFFGESRRLLGGSNLLVELGGLSTFLRVVWCF